MPVEYTLDGQAGVKDQEMSRELKANVSWLKEYLGYKETFDLIVREFKIGSRQVALVYLDSFVAQTDLTLIMEELFNTPDDQLTSPSLRGLLNRKVPFIEITAETKLNKAADQILAGPAALLVDGITHTIIMDVRKYPGRKPSEPSLERVLRGPKDGFVETLIFNTILIRRRLRDPNLRIEMHEVGRRSNSDLALIYQMRRKPPPFRAEISGADPVGVNPGFPVARCIA